MGAGLFALLGVIGVCSGLAGVIKGAFGAFGKVLVGTVFLVLGPLSIRIWCELVILAFRIHDSLVEIAKNTASRV